MLYPEGWTVREAPSGVSIADKNNLVRIAVVERRRRRRRRASQAQLAALKRSTPGLTVGRRADGPAEERPCGEGDLHDAERAQPGDGQAGHADGRPLRARARRARGDVDLGTPVGVDNVDAYKRMIESFKWR